MRILVLIISFMLLAPPVMAAPTMVLPDELLVAAADSGTPDKPVLIIKGKGGKVTKVKKPKGKK